MHGLQYRGIIADGDSSVFAKIPEKVSYGKEVTPAEIEQISATTIGQFNNQRYMSERSFRVTASNFGSVVKRRLNTACYNLVKKVLHGDIVQSEAVTYGKIKESVAINRFEKELGKNVQPAGLYTLYIYFRDY
ncbi:exonuclease phage-type/recb c-terminal [Holotrichia oblita]|uniref:Exonuclease phage-type/recb c-terminal n=1 Tax=Holotrichia oblita TaxID=644536 RepID=A0ACB9SKF7_HOLOL|nr:exonuclease phage-type/recb c-terminal [Holotrichia oblita]